jgi:hypothetical protein
VTPCINCGEPGNTFAMTEPVDQHVEEHLKAEEDDGSAELQPEDGGAASPGKTSEDVSTTGDR